MSTCAPALRGSPRWSPVRNGLSPSAVSSPASSAGLPQERACVCVGPPLSASGSSSGSRPMMSDAAAGNPNVGLWIKLCPPEVTLGTPLTSEPLQSPRPVLPAIMLLCSVTEPGRAERLSTPPAPTASLPHVLPVTVQLIRKVIAQLLVSIPPPARGEELEVTVQFTS